MKILIIEDEVLIQKSLMRLLQKKNAQVEVASAGKEALEKIFNHRFDRIVCDLMLKDITGFDIIEESKKVYSNDEISDIFIIITAYSSPQVIDKAASYGCHILNKPFKNINQAISTMLGKESA